MTGDVPFDAITTFFVFLIGLPAIIFQWLAPEVRQIIVKRPVELLLDAGAPVVAGISIVGIGLYTPNQWKWLWPMILAALFLLAIFTAFRIPRKYVRRTAVVSRLERQASRSSGATVRLVEPVLLDLIELGNQSQPGREKELVLQALLGLSESVCAADGYDGDQLLDVAFGVLDVVLNGPEAGSSQNLATAADILKQPLRALDAKGNWEFKQADLLHSIRALSRLGRQAVNAENESVSIAVVQVLGSTGSQHRVTSVATSRALFEIGVAAVERNQILAAMSCAQSLTALVGEDGAPAKDVIADTLGLLAHFWTSGETGRRYAERHMEQIEETLSVDLATALSESALHCAQTTQFRTSDKVHAVIAARTS